MHFILDPLVLANYPDVAIGIIVANGIENAPVPETAHLLREAEQAVQRSMTLETFKEHPHVKAMQEIHRSFGNNPNKFPPSVQALLKRVLKGGELPSINPLVDLYNVLSLRHTVCAGAEDLDRCGGDIRLAYADGTEHFVPLGETANDSPDKGELVYKDDDGVICRKLNWREGDRTKITNDTKNAVLVVEGFPPVTVESLRQILDALAELVRRLTRGTTRIEILTKDHFSTVIS